MTVGPQAFTLGDLDVLNAFVACLTAVWIVKAGNAIEATAWKLMSRAIRIGDLRFISCTHMLRLTKTIPRREFSDRPVARSVVEGPWILALYVSYETSPKRYSHEMPYALVTTHGATTGRKASPISEVYAVYREAALMAVRSRLAYATEIKDGDQSHLALSTGT